MPVPFFFGTEDNVPAFLFRVSESLAPWIFEIFLETSSVGFAGDHPLGNLRSFSVLRDGRCKLKLLFPAVKDLYIPGIPDHE